MCGQFVELSLDVMGNGEWHDQDASVGNRIGPNSTIMEYWGPLGSELEAQSQYASNFFLLAVVQFKRRFILFRSDDF